MPLKQTGADMAPSRSRTGPIVGLDLVRIAAATLVLFHHLAWWEWAQFAGKAAATVPVFPALGPLCAQGWVGVEIFFVLSGFVIAFSASGSNLLSFLRSRFIRLYPAAWICGSITALIRVWLGGETFSSLRAPWIHTLLLLPRSTWVDSVYWTLGLEMAFYLLLAILLAAKRVRWIEPVMALLGIVSTAFWVQSLLVDNGLWSSPVAHRIRHWFMEGRWSNIILLQHGCYFAAGVFLWLILLHRSSAWRLMVLACTIVGGGIGIHSHYVTIMSMAAVKASSAGWISPLLIWLLSLACIVVAVRGNDRLTSMLHTRGLRFVRLLALLTYPVYLLHQFIGYILMRQLYRTLPADACLLLAILVALSIAYVVHSFGEVPLHGVLRQVLNGRSRRAMPATTLP